MTNLYIIRHCEAEGNIYRRAQGQHDGRISPKGEKQIAALAERFRDVPIDAAYSSDLERARRTAGAILKYRELPLHTDSRLREWGLGIWEDMPFGNLEYLFPEQMYNFNNDPAAWRAEGGEPYEALRRRLWEAFREIAERHPDQSVAVVSHGMAIRTFLADILNIPSERIGSLPHGDNTAVSLVETDGTAWRVVYASDAGHLPPELSTLSRQSWWRDTGQPDPQNVRFVRLDPARYPSRYMGFYEKTWLAVHGNLDGFQPVLYRNAALRHLRAHPEAVVTIVRPDGETAGIIELDTERLRDKKTGWICLCYIEKAYRRQLLGVQLIGHAVTVFRSLGYRAMQLNVFEQNLGAIRFYEACEFRAVGETTGVNDARLLIMEKEL